MVYLSRNDYEMTKLKNARFDPGLDFELNYGLNYGLVHRIHTNANWVLPVENNFKKIPNYEVCMMNFHINTF